MGTQPNLIEHFEKICADFFKNVVKKVVKTKTKKDTDIQKPN